MSLKPYGFFFWLLLYAALYVGCRSATQGTAGVGFFTMFQWRLFLGMC
jgi:hypothetical protein